MSDIEFLTPDDNSYAREMLRAVEAAVAGARDAAEKAAGRVLHLPEHALIARTAFILLDRALEKDLAARGVKASDIEVGRNLAAASAKQIASVMAVRVVERNQAEAAGAFHKSVDTES